ncbi:pyruvate kinase [Thermosulfurimonas marina]|uniref:Pyruvate kinase n=1 Tax=Thermosulfurimonas marina TaxID=2047767 RepID=A0A6H1WS01_9BACT|nr:pyruvate kinase [Thermosulfurimonas marina]QJA05973.1 pyruvate kinase [Thermosulfurimonas marina]
MRERPKSKIVATIGPACASQKVLQQMIQAGMEIARLNLAHGNLETHKKYISLVRAAARAVGRRVALLADLPGPKIRVGLLPQEPLELKRGTRVFIVPEEKSSDPRTIPIPLPGLLDFLRPKQSIYLNDGLIQLLVEEVSRGRAQARVVVGGELFSHKGVNLPGMDLGISAFTEEDRRLMAFALSQGVEAIGLSFVQGPEDVREAREYARSLGYAPFLIAKIERAQGVRHLSAILAEADGIMIARGDLGVELPIEEIAIVQKSLIEKAALAGKVVITATQMLKSMTTTRRPTRAEVTDVTNAILDGTDGLMLSEETAAGLYPVEAVRMMARIARTTEKERRYFPVREKILEARGKKKLDLDEVLSLDVFTTVEHLKVKAVIIPTESGETAIKVARFRLPVWIYAFSPHESVCQRLLFYYGIRPVLLSQSLSDWQGLALHWLRKNVLKEGLVLSLQRTFLGSHRSHRLDLIELERD